MTDMENTNDTNVQEEATAQEETAVQEPVQEQAAAGVAIEDKEPMEHTNRNKKKRKRGCAIAAIVVGSIALVIILLIALVPILNVVTTKALIEQAKSFEKVAYADQLVPTKDADGYYTFTTDRDLNVLQLTDVHIGSGFLSKDEDPWAMNAVATMVRKSTPDLVIITGDISYPVPFSSGSFNNLNPAKVFANEMEALGVYWTFAFGNHDTEAYSYYTRQEICDWYAEQNFKYCLFSANNDIADKDEAESFGYGNNIIKVKNSAGVITQALVLFDSHSYTDGDVFGALWKYDNIHQNQIDWYTQEMAKLRQQNAAKGVDAPIKNLAFFHIPLREYREAWGELVETNGKMGVRGEVMANSEHVEYIYGYNDEITGASANPLAKSDENTYGVFCGVKNEALAGKFWAAAKANAMQGAFCGHDHINNFSVRYTKDDYTMRLTYGMSVDYLAYAGIFKQHSQRGCTAIVVRPDGSFDCQQRNYYTDFNVDYEVKGSEE
ncbi:MAG: metallophosphoesterase [Clostridia bacterium]|nr:metallophosphoesterase [Clostridia bacterium]